MKALRERRLLEDNKKLQSDLQPRNLDADDISILGSSVEFVGRNTAQSC